MANDVENETPPAPAERPKPEPKAAPEPPPKDAVSLKMPEKTKQLLTPKQRLKSFSEIASNQLTSKGPQAVSSPLYYATWPEPEGLAQLLTRPWEHYFPLTQRASRK